MTKILKAKYRVCCLPQNRRLLVVEDMHEKVRSSADPTTWTNNNKTTDRRLTARKVVVSGPSDLVGIC